MQNMTNHPQQGADIGLPKSFVLEAQQLEARCAEAFSGLDYARTKLARMSDGAALGAEFRDAIIALINNAESSAFALASHATDEMGRHEKRACPDQAAPEIETPRFLSATETAYDRLTVAIGILQAQHLAAGSVLLPERIWGLSHMKAPALEHAISLLISVAEEISE